MSTAPEPNNEQAPEQAPDASQAVAGSAPSPQPDPARSIDVAPDVASAEDTEPEKAKPEKAKPEDAQTDTPESDAVESDTVESDAPEGDAEPKSKPETPPPTEPDDQPLTQPGMKWYVLRVASNKEERVRDALEKKVKIEAIENHIGRILVPTLKEKRMKGGVAKVVEKKLYPGYVFVEMAPESDGSIPENVWFLVKETMGVGDFISSDGKPTSMMDHEVAKMLDASLKADDTPSLSGLDFQKGDRVKINEGSFESYEGDVDTVDTQKGMITVLLTIFGRATPVDVEYWQLEKI